MKIGIQNKEINFIKANIQIIERDLTSVFAEYSKMTLEEILTHKKYRHLNEKYSKNYHNSLYLALGEFLNNLKLSNNYDYHDFLNEYGDKSYCKFNVDNRISNEPGIFIFKLNNQIIHIGKSSTNLYREIKTGFGNITPKNCYLDGQVTHCRVNNFINDMGEIELYIKYIQKEKLKYYFNIIKCKLVS